MTRNAKDLMRAASKTRESQPLKMEEAAPKVEKAQIEKIENVQEMVTIEQHRPAYNPPQRKTYPRKSIGELKEHPARFVMRPDVSPDVYAIKPPQGSLGIYDREVDDFISTFSKENQRNGGVAITKSQLIEIALGVLHYDLHIAPVGYESHDELREDIQSRINR